MDKNINNSNEIINDEYINIIVESYCNDNNIKDKDKVKKYLLELFNTNKLNEISKDFFYSTKYYQRKVINNFLDITFNPDKIVNKSNILIYNTINESLESFFDDIIILKRKYIDGMNLQNDSNFKFVLSIIEANHNNCNNSCTPMNFRLNNELYSMLIFTKIDDLNTSQVNSQLDMLYRMIRKTNPNTTNPKVINNISKCLRMCYLDYLTSIYAQGVINYNFCTGNIIKTYDELLAFHPEIAPGKEQCNDIYSYLIELFTKINKLIDIIYNNDSIKKKSWMNVINEKIKAYKENKRYVIDFSKIDDEYVNPNDYVRSF